MTNTVSVGDEEVLLFYSGGWYQLITTALKKI